MHIYIDEAGSFTCFSEARSSISCVVALVVPESVHDSLLEEFEKLTQKWTFRDEEVKGRLLREPHFDEAIRLVFRTGGAFLRISAIDMGIHTVPLVEDHKRRQAERLRSAMDERFSKSLVEQIQHLAGQVEDLAPQLYVESTLLTQLVVSIIQTATLLYSQLEPPALGRFSWRIDAKDRSTTEYEELWRVLVLPFVQSASLRAPMIFLTEGDYSYFAPFENPDLPSSPEHLRGAVPHPDETFSAFSVNRVMTSDLEFADSKSSLGLQLVDVLASCFRRACNQRLQPEGWKHLGRIIVRDPQTDLAVQLCSLSDAIPIFYPSRDMPYAQTLDHIADTSRGYLIRGFLSNEA